MKQLQVKFCAFQRTSRILTNLLQLGNLGVPDHGVVNHADIDRLLLLQLVLVDTDDDLCDKKFSAFDSLAFKVVDIKFV